MPVFGRNKAKLAEAMRDATLHPAAYHKVYDALSKHADAPAKALDLVLRAVDEKEPKESRLRARIKGSGGRWSPSGATDSSASAGSMAQSIALLQVLQGIVWSYPAEMSVLLSEKTTGAKILKVIISPGIPVQVRQVLLSMAARWCLLYSNAPGARSILESVVDVAKQRVGLLPSPAYLPRPPIVCEQEAWQYPEKTPLPGVPFMYSLDPPIPAPAAEQPSEAAVRAAGTAQPQNAVLPSGQEALELTPSLIEHMEKCARELKNLCDMITENLISLNVDEDPASNPVVIDMLQGLRVRRATVANYLNLLTPDKPLTLQKLNMAMGEVKRCLLLYDKTIASHKEWVEEEKRRRQQLGRQPAPGPQGVVYNAAGPSSKPFACSSSSSSSALAGQPESSKAAAKAPPAAAGAANGAANGQLAGSRVSSLAHLSSKAKGKMPDLSGPDGDDAPGLPSCMSRGVAAGGSGSVPLSHGCPS